MNVDVNKCLHCGGCVGSCPKNAIFLNDFVLEFNDDCIKVPWPRFPWSDHP